MKRLVGFVVIWVALWPSLAFGEVTVTVLGLRSATADEQIAGQVTVALRRAADGASSSGLSHTGRENQLSQLLVVFECDETTSRCMREIGRSLNSQRLVYGLVEPESGRSDADFAVTLRYFNVDTGEVERDLRERIPRGASGQGLNERVAQFFNALTGISVRGELAITCNVEGAQVLIGDREVGTTTDEPLVIGDLEAGDVTVEIRHDDYEAFRETVTIDAGGRRALDVELGELGGQSTGNVGGVETVGDGQGTGQDWTEPVQDEERRSLAWLGWTTLGLSAVFGGLGLWTSIHVNGVRNDERLQENFSEQVNICDTAALSTPNGYPQAEADDICDTATTLEMLQAVFYPLAAVSFGLGLWLVIREMGRDDDDDDARRLDVVPIAFQDGGALSATLTF